MQAQQEILATHVQGVTMGVQQALATGVGRHMLQEKVGIEERVDSLSMQMDEVLESIQELQEWEPEVTVEEFNDLQEQFHVAQYCALHRINEMDATCAEKEANLAAQLRAVADRVEAQ